MNKSSVLFHSIFVLFAVFIYGKSFSEPPNLSTIKNEVKLYHDNGEYIKDVAIVTHKAQQYLRKAISQHPHQKLALVLDIDETLLSNYDNLVARDFMNEPQRIHADTLKADATPILPSLKLFNYAKAQHIKIFLVSGRYENERFVTIKNLRRAGFSGWDALYLQPNSNYGKHGTIEEFKISTRKFLTKKGYLILASIGDQPTDFSGGYTLKSFKLPNPFYYSLSRYTVVKKAA